MAIPLGLCNGTGSCNPAGAWPGSPGMSTSELWHRQERRGNCCRHIRKSRSEQALILLTIKGRPVCAIPLCSGCSPLSLSHKKDAEQRAALILKVLYVWHTNCLVAYIPTKMTPYFDEILIRVSPSSIILFLFPSFSLYPKPHHPVPAAWRLLVLSLPLTSNCFLTSHRPELFPSGGGLNSSVCPIVSESPSRRDVCVLGM